MFGATLQQLKNKMKTAVIGSGGMGKLIAREYKSHRDAVVITDVDIEYAKKAADELGVGAADTADAIKDSDEIVLATSLLATPEVIDEYRALFTSDKVVYDIASVKFLQTRGVSITDELGSLEARTLSVHPLFGPDASGFSDYNVLLVPTNDGSPVADYERFFGETLGAKTHVFEDGDTHDKYMAQVIANMHLLGYLGAMTQEGRDIPFKELLPLAGTTFLMGRAFTEFVVSSSLDVYPAIQIENKYSSRNLDALAKGLSTLTSIIESGDYKVFGAEVNRLRDYFSSQDPDFGPVGSPSPIRDRFSQAVEASKWSPTEYADAKKAVDDMRKK